MAQGEIPDTLTIRLGATPSGLISDPPPLSPIFTPDALRAATLTLHPGLGQTPNMLACIPSGPWFRSSADMQQCSQTVKQATQCVHQLQKIKSLKLHVEYMSVKLDEADHMHRQVRVARWCNRLVNVPTD